MATPGPLNDSCILLLCIFSLMVHFGSEPILAVRHTNRVIMPRLDGQVQLSKKKNTYRAGKATSRTRLLYVSEGRWLNTMRPLKQSIELCNNRLSALLVALVSHTLQHLHRVETEHNKNTRTEMNSVCFFFNFHSMCKRATHWADETQGV